MKLHSTAVPIIAIGAVLFTAWGASMDPAVRSAWLREEAQRPRVGAVSQSPIARSWHAIWKWIHEPSRLERVPPKLWVAGDGPSKTAHYDMEVLAPRLDAAREAAVEANAENVTWRKPETWEPIYDFYNGASVGWGPGTTDSPKAFPSCVGPGCGAGQQMRPNGARICRVTNLNATGAGSFYACQAIVHADSNTVNKPWDIIVFDTAGAIEYNPGCGGGNDCNIWRGSYIMGQSAPGPINFYQYGIIQQEGSQDNVWRGFSSHGQVGNSSTNWRMVGRREVASNVSFSHGSQRQIQSAAFGADYGPWDSIDYGRYHTWYRMLFSYKTKYYDRTNNYSNSPTAFMLNSTPRAWNGLTHILENQVVIYVDDLGCGYRYPNINADTVWSHNNFLALQCAGNQWQQASDGAIIDYTYNEWRYDASPNPSTSTYWPVSQDSLDGCTWLNNDTIPSICQPPNGDLFHYNKNHVSHIQIANGFYVGDYGDTIKSQDSIWTGNPGGRYIGTYPGLGSTTDSTTPPINRRRTSGLPNSTPWGWDTLTVNYANMMLILDSAGGGLEIDSFGNPWMNRDTVDIRARKSVIDTASYNDPGDFNRDSFLVDYFPNWQLKVHAKCRDEDHGGAGDGMCDRWEINASGDTALEPDDVMPSGYFAIELAYEGGILNADTVFAGSPLPNVPSEYAFRGAEGYGKTALAACRDSVYYGGDGIHGNADDWPLKVWIVDPATYGGDSDDPMAIQAVMDSASNDAYDIVLLPKSGHAAIHLSYASTDRYKLKLDKSCLYISGGPAQGEGPPVLWSGYDERTPKVVYGSDSTGLHDFLMRDIKVYGDSFNAPYTSTFNILQVFGGRNLYFYHTAWHLGADGVEFFGNYDTLTNLTWDASLTGGVGATGEPEFASTNWALDMWDEVGDFPLWYVSILRSAFMSSYYRMPATGSGISDPDSFQYTGPVEWINTMTYDAFGNRMALMYGDDSMDVIGAWFGEGSDQTHYNGEVMVRGCYSPQNGDCGNGGGPWYGTPGIYVSDAAYYKAKVRAWGNDSIFKYLPGTTDGPQWPLPDSLKNGQRQGSSNVSTIWSNANVPDSLWGAGDIRRQVGAVLTLTCGGTFQLKRDSTSDWFYQRYVNNSVGNTNTTIRGWGSQVYKDSMIGTTPCPDTDQDGLPDAFESWSGVTEADSLIYDYFAIEHYLNGDSAYLADLLAGGPPEPPASSTRTYSGKRYVFLFPLAGVVDVDTLLIIEFDTFNVKGRTATFDSVPPAAYGGPQNRQWIPGSHDSAFVLTCDSLSSAFLDSATTSSTFSAWGIVGDEPWAYDTAGLGCGG